MKIKKSRMLFLPRVPFNYKATCTWPPEVTASENEDAFEQMPVDGIHATLCFPHKHLLKKTRVPVTVRLKEWSHVAQCLGKFSLKIRLFLFHLLFVCCWSFGKCVFLHWSLLEGPFIPSACFSMLECRCQTQMVKAGSCWWQWVWDPSTHPDTSVQTVSAPGTAPFSPVVVHHVPYAMVTLFILTSLEWSLFVALSSLSSLSSFHLVIKFCLQHTFLPSFSSIHGTTH